MQDHGASPGPSTPPPALRFDIVTLFPDLFGCWLGQGVVSRAIEKGLVEVSLVNLREFGVGRHKVTDDYPFGGGAGMVMKPEPLFDAVRSISVQDGTPIILLSPRGTTFTQRMAENLADRDRLVLIAGHYEGVDERVREHLVTDEISVGDYILSAGELAGMVVADAVARLVPGALATDSVVEESFARGLLEYPQYTRPARYGNWRVPDVLLSGNHGEIARWRRQEAIRGTFERRPDLLRGADLTEHEQEMILAWEQSPERLHEQTDCDAGDADSAGLDMKGVR